MSKINLQIDDHLDIEVGDSVIVIKRDGSIGKVILPEMSNEQQQTKGYKQMLKVLDVLNSNIVLQKQKFQICHGYDGRGLVIKTSS